MNKTVTPLLILGIGNVLMGDEGVGVHVIRHLESLQLPEGVTCLDGGTGGFHLLGPVQEAGQVILIDATIDGAPPGTVRRLYPKFSSDYPVTLTAHDIGLKDLLDALHLLDATPAVVLFTISIHALPEPDIELSRDIKASIPIVVDRIFAEVESLTSQSAALQL